MSYETGTTAQAIIDELPRIAKSEGLKKYIYRCPAGHPTFGFGTKITKGMPEYRKRMGSPVSEQRCLEAFFNEVVGEVYPDTQKAFGRGEFNKLPYAAKGVFADFLYNVGLTTFREFIQMRKAVLARDWDRAADELLNSKYADDVGPRAKRLADRLRRLGGLRRRT